MKFIERNWHLSTISNRSRDNLPDPTYNTLVSDYAPTNSPANSDLLWGAYIGGIRAGMQQQEHRTERGSAWILG